MRAAQRIVSSRIDLQFADSSMIRTPSRERGGDRG